MKTLLIVYASVTGAARQMAEAVAGGAAREPGVRCRLLRADEAGAQDVLAADGYIFVSPERLAALCGQMKWFFDRTYYPALDRVNGRPYALMISAGSDGQNAVRQAIRIATGWRLKAVAEPLIVCTHAQTPEAILAPKTVGAEDLQRCAETGQALAAGLAAGIF
ncbi:MAG TPA: NAD(P)H-dependent oxidoreductase [Alphaproteobacteria bacterium]|jgi:NAD(P)H-dependent FMN reductase|nr:NAD(P)H-dependent oxidoreductase [Alphaproteobacteria bacterium]